MANEFRSEMPELAGYGQMNAVGFLATLALAIEKPRVAAQVRLAHLAKHGKQDPLTEEILVKIRQLESYIDSRTVAQLESHPAAHWFLRIKNLRGEAFAKVISEFEGFGRYYEVGEPMIPRYNGQAVPERYRRRETYTVSIDGEDKDFVWVSAIERFVEPSDLRKYSGLYPGARAAQGEKLAFNRQMRTMLWRVSENLIRANGKLKGFYDQYRAYKLNKYAEEGNMVVPTPKGRLCPQCLEEKDIPTTTRFCPDCGSALAHKNEPPGIIFAGHFHNMCRRRMMQIFLDCFWVVYRQAEGLPIRPPYVVEFLGHESIITPEDLCDQPAS